MQMLSHIIAVRRTPAEICEVNVPSDAEGAKIAQLEARFETVFVARRFPATSHEKEVRHGHP